MDPTELLIDLVRERPILYDRSSNKFKDSRRLKENNWTDIAKIMKERLNSEDYTSRFSS